MSNKLLSVLIAEDDPAILHLARSVLTKEGFTVHSCTNGEEAIIEIKSRTFDLVIVDETMPKVNGSVVAEFIRQNEATGQIPIILITAENNPLHFNQMLQSGLINMLMPKPFSPKLFLNMVNLLMQKKSRN